MKVLICKEWVLDMIICRTWKASYKEPPKSSVCLQKNYHFWNFCQFQAKKHQIPEEVLENIKSQIKKKNKF